MKIRERKGSQPRIESPQRIEFDSSNRRPPSFRYCNLVWKSLRLFEGCFNVVFMLYTAT